MKTHKDLDVWKESMFLAERLYLATKRFPTEELYGLVSQMRRAAVSIPSNISEGAGRNTKKEFIQFLYVALGSAAELETQLILADRLGYPVANDGLLARVENIMKMLNGLIRKLKEVKP